jgi:hypothetical protein
MLPTRTTPDLLGGRRPHVEPTAASAGTLDTRIKLLEARDPKSKGMVERMNQAFRNRFISGGTFISLDTINDQLTSSRADMSTSHSFTSNQPFTRVSTCSATVNGR